MQTKVFLPRLFSFKLRFFFSAVPHHDTRSPYDILGVSPSASLTDIKKAYHTLSKVYHPDKNRSKDAVEKFKTINNAYNTLKQYHGEHSAYRKSYNGGYSKQHHYEREYDSRENGPKNGSKTSGEAKSYTEEEKLYEEIFGKSYSSDPMFFYRKENAELKKNYEERLRKIKQNQKEREDRKAEDHFRGSFHHFRDQNHTYQEERRNPEDMVIGKILAVAGVTLGIFLWLYYTKQTPKQNLEQQKEMVTMVERFREKEMRKSREKLEKSKENYLKSLPKMKKISIMNEPDAEELLVDFTIYPDIKIYSVPHAYFYGQNMDLTNSNNFEKVKLRNLKTNTAISLSLEAERLLKNTFVNVKTLQKIIEEKGFYEPPGLFTRFFGFIYIKLRKMPIITENLKPGVEWISLFDLYIRYNSPLPYINEDFYEFKVKPRKSQWLGNVTLNHRKIQKINLKGGEKNVFFWRGSQPMNFPESRYISVWENFYNIPKDKYL